MLSKMELLLWFSGGLTPENQAQVIANALPYPVEVFTRPATSLVHNENAMTE